MNDDQEQRPDSLMPYDDWTEAAMRQVMVRALNYAAAHGLPARIIFTSRSAPTMPGLSSRRACGRSTRRK